MRGCMEFHYIISPFLAWLVTGIIKFILNSIKAKRFAFDLIGYGGMPSNHTAIVTSICMLIALKEGVNHPSFGVALTLAFIVVLDANSLRQQVGKHAKAINDLAKNDKDFKTLRERMGHTRLEIVVGALVGSIVAILLNILIK